MASPQERSTAVRRIHRAAVSTEIASPLAEAPNI